MINLEETKEEIIEKIISALAVDCGDRRLAEAAFIGFTPLRGVLIMLEVLGLIRFRKPSK